jgi:hypothetical protein
MLHNRSTPTPIFWWKSRQEEGPQKNIVEKYSTIIIEDNLEMAGAEKMLASLIIIIAAAEHSGL